MRNCAGEAGKAGNGYRGLRKCRPRQEFATGAQKRGLRDGRPSVVQGQSPSGDLGANPQNLETDANFQLWWGDIHPCPPGYAAARQYMFWQMFVQIIDENEEENGTLEGRHSIPCSRWNKLHLNKPVAICPKAKPESSWTPAHQYHVPSASPKYVDASPYWML